MVTTEVRPVRKTAVEAWNDRWHWVRDQQRSIVGTLVAVTFLLGAWGFWLYFARTGEARDLWDIAYLDLQLFVLQSGDLRGWLPIQLQFARFAAPILATVTIAEALASIFEEQIAFFRLRFLMRDHLVVCGLGWVGWLLAREISAERGKVVVIEKNVDNALLAACKEYGAVVLLGDAGEPYMLRKAQLSRARYLVAATGQDGTNAQIALTARKLLHPAWRHLDCYVHVVDPQLCALLAAQEIERENQDLVHIEFFNIFESGARALLKEHSAFSSAEATDGKPSHILIVGLNEMGLTLIIHIACDWWRAHGSSCPLKMTVADKESRAKIEALQTHYPQLAVSCSFAFLDLHRLEDGVNLHHWPQIPEDASIVYVCFDNDSEVLSVALTLREQMRERDTPIVACLSRENGLASLVSVNGSPVPDYVGLHAFGFLDRTCKPGVLFSGTHEILARSLHKAFRVCVESRLIEKSEEDQAAWDDAATEYREFFQLQARRILNRLSWIGCHVGPFSDWDVAPFVFTREEIDVLVPVGELERVRRLSRRGMGPDVELRGAVAALADSSQMDPLEYARQAVSGLPILLAGAGLQLSRSAAGGRTGPGLPRPVTAGASRV